MWVVPIVIVTLLGTVGGAMSLSGSVVRPIALGEATIVMFGQSFLNRFTPMNAGGMAMRIRYLQKGGTDGAVAAAAIGLTSAASGVVQVVFFVFFVVVANADPTGGLSVKSDAADLSIVSVFAIAIIAAVIVLAVAPKLRRWVVDVVKSTFDKVKNDFGELARRPTKLSLLFGGQALAKLSTICSRSCGRAERSTSISHSSNSVPCTWWPTPLHLRCRHRVASVRSKRPSSSC